MVKRQLILLVTMAMVVLGTSAGTVLNVRNNQSFTSKWLPQANMFPLGFLLRGHAPNSSNLPYVHHVKRGTVMRFEGDLSVQDTSSLEGSPGVLDSTCLQLFRCQEETTFYFDYMEIYHADLPERSAAACGHLCLRQRPESRLVMAKLSPVNERLVCGCGDEEALPSLSVSGAVLTCSQPCPDGEDSCGGSRAVSVYRVDHEREECVAPDYSYHGCYRGEVGAAALSLEPWERWAGGCRARCKSLPSSEALMGLTTTANGTILCDCWVSDDALESSAEAEGQQECGWKCRDGQGWCGAAGLVSVYYQEEAEGNEASRQHPIPSRLLLHLLALVLCLACHEVLL